MFVQFIMPLVVLFDGLLQLAAPSFCLELVALVF